MTIPSHWPDIARRWEAVGAPLRPSAPDLAAYEAAGRARPGDRLLMLGVTPEIYHLPWPSGADILAVDHTMTMIDSVWPGPRSAAVCADWTAMSLAQGSRHLALCDGGLHLLTHPHGQAALVRNLARVLVPGGIFALRLFVPPSCPETAAEVISDTVAGKVASVNVLKLRLAMALQDNPSDGVQLAGVWAALFGGGMDPADLALSTGWDPADLSTLDSYRDCAALYHFVTLGQVEQLFCTDPGGFEMVSVTTQSYELGERCPTVVLRRLLPTEAGR